MDRYESNYYNRLFHKNTPKSPTLPVENKKERKKQKKKRKKICRKKKGVRLLKIRLPVEKIKATKKGKKLLPKKRKKTSDSLKKVRLPRKRLLEKLRIFLSVLWYVIHV